MTAQRETGLRDREERLRQREERALHLDATLKGTAPAGETLLRCQCLSLWLRTAPPRFRGYFFESFRFWSKSGIKGWFKHPTGFFLIWDPPPGIPKSLGGWVRVSPRGLKKKLGTNGVLEPGR